MSKAKNPLLSMGAQGSIADSLSYQSRKRDTIVRTKSSPSYTLTLPQQYQRWLYQDYSYMWTLQSSSTQRLYASEGVRHHLTGFQYWMSYHLKYLPDIAAWWRFDRVNPPAAIDSSKNSNDGVYIGARLATGLIDMCLLFDGINDRMTVSAPLHNIPVSHACRTFEAFVYLDKSTDNHSILSYGTNSPSKYINWLIAETTRELVLACWADSAFSGFIIQLETWYHLAIIMTPPKTVKFFVDGTPFSTVYLTNPFDTAPGYNLYIGMELGIRQFWPGRIDNVIIYNRELCPEEILRHSLRRYPA